MPGGLVPRPLIFSAGLQLTLSGCVLFAAMFSLQWMTAFGWHGFGAALTCFAVVAALVLLSLGQHRPHRRFGVANAVTLTRATLATLMVGVVSEMLLGGTLVADAALGWILVVTATAALLLDGVDG